MLIHSRPIAISAGVITFFALGLVSASTGLSPLTCCKRALIAAALVYIAASIAVSVLDAILTKAVIDSHAGKRKENQSVG
jgi:hypothetical protein